MILQSAPQGSVSETEVNLRLSDSTLLRLCANFQRFKSQLRFTLTSVILADVSRNREIYWVHGFVIGGFRAILRASVSQWNGGCHNYD